MDKKMEMDVVGLAVTRWHAWRLVLVVYVGYRCRWAMHEQLAVTQCKVMHACNGPVFVGK